jgi:hypothetical protein
MKGSLKLKNLLQTGATLLSLVFYVLLLPLAIIVFFALNIFYWIVELAGFRRERE